MAAKKLILGLKTAFLWCTFGIERVTQEVIIQLSLRQFQIQRCNVQFGRRRLY